MLPLLAALGGRLAAYLPHLLSAAPLIADAARSFGSAPSEAAAKSMERTRDDIAKKLTAAGMESGQATELVNGLVETAMKQGGTGGASGGELAGDLVGAFGGRAAGKLAGKFGKSAAKSTTSEIKALPYEPPARGGKNRGVGGDKGTGRLGYDAPPPDTTRGKNKGVGPTEPPVRERGAVEVVTPPDGGIDPMSKEQSELGMLLAAARAKAKRPPRMPEVDTLGLPAPNPRAGHGDREFMRDIAYEADPRLEQKAAQMRAMRDQMDAESASAMDELFKRQAG